MIVRRRGGDPDGQAAKIAAGLAWKLARLEIKKLPSVNDIGDDGYGYTTGLGSPKAAAVVARLVGTSSTDLGHAASCRYRDALPEADLPHSHYQE